jgi:glutathione S-transferase
VRDGACAAGLDESRASRRSASLRLPSTNNKIEARQREINMPYVAIVTVLALLQFFWFGWQVGVARTRFNVPAPAVSGNEGFERAFRVQMNTQEQLVVFLPALWIFAYIVSPIWAAALGAVFIVGRALYARAYVSDPKTRSLGFALTALPNLLLLLGILIWSIWALVKTPAL